MDEVRCGQQWLQAKAGGREERLREWRGVLSVLAMSFRDREKERDRNRVGGRVQGKVH